jgi:hypothetical protein
MYRHRHARLFSCVSLPGDALTLFIIPASLIHDTLWSRGSQQGEDEMIRQRSLALSPLFPGQIENKRVICPDWATENVEMILLGEMICNDEQINIS